MKLLPIVFLFTAIFTFNKNLLPADQEIEIERNTLSNILIHGSLVELDKYLKSKIENQPKETLDDYVSLLNWNIDKIEEDKIKEIALINLKYDIDINDTECKFSALWMSTFDTFWHATESGYVKSVKNLILLGADINEEHRVHGTYLMNACRGRYKDIEDYLIIIRYLVDNGIDINKQIKNGSTALTRAAYNDQPKIVYLLLTLGADPKININQKISFLKAAENKPEIMKAYKYYLNTKKFREAMYKAFKNLPDELIDMICDCTIIGFNNIND